MQLKQESGAARWPNPVIMELLEVTGILAYQTSQEISSAFGVEAVIGNHLLFTQPAAWRKIAPQKGWNSHNGQKQWT